MCGLLFLHLKDNIKFNISNFKEALDLSSYRGKDDQKIIEFKKNYFGFNRLSIVGSDYSNQPISDNEKILIFNGELYDYNKTYYESDTLNLFELSKDKKFYNLEGQYAFVLYDKLNNTFEIYRDQFGQKPMYYLNHQKFFIASSTIKSILSLYKSLTNNELEIDKKIIDEYLLFGYFREPNTIYSRIKILESGKMLSYNAFNIQSKNYLKKKNINKLDYFNFFEKTLKHSNKNKSLFLSSGIDSNYILAKLMKLNIDFNIYTLKNINKKIDESNIVIKNLEKLNIIKKLEIINSQNNNLIDEIKKLSKIYELPSSDGLNLFYLLQNMNNKHNSKIIFSGVGGDEIFGGYNTFKYFYFFKFLKLIKFPFNLVKKLKRFNLFKGDVFSYYAAYKCDPFFFKLIKKNNINEIFFNISNNIDYKNNNISFKYIIRELEINEYMKNQLLRDSDNLSLYFGKEIFNPFLSSYLYSNNIDNKKNLKDQIKKIGIILSKKKKGFSISFQNNKIEKDDFNILVKNNLKFNIVEEKYFNEIFNNKKYIKQQIKLCIILFWLEYNT